MSTRTKILSLESTSEIPNTSLYVNTMPTKYIYKENRKYYLGRIFWFFNVICRIFFKNHRRNDKLLSGLIFRYEIYHRAYRQDDEIIGRCIGNR